MIKDSIVLVPFPFDDYSTLKVRPALCLTASIGKFDHVVIAFISSKIDDDTLSSDIIIKKGSNKVKNEPELKSGQPSTVIDKAYT